MTWRVVQGDCVERMRELAESSVDAVVCDPPYGLEFMGRSWDKLTPEAGRADLKDRTNFAPTKSEFKDGVGTRVGAPQKNPRCRKCGKLKFDHDKGKCRCAAPDWNTRQSEYAYLQQVWHEAWATEALRVLKPGGHLLAFGGTRTVHRLACAVEDAGFEIRDTICWLYGSGFPKSLDVGKSIDKAAGVERVEVGPSPRHGGGIVGAGSSYELPPEPHMLTAPATPEAEQWQGWGTALKPAHEPVVVARKPLDGTVASTVLRHGTGALNVDGCRVEGDVPATVQGGQRSSGGLMNATGGERGTEFVPASGGRWPANVALDPEAARLLDEQTGELPRGGGKPPRRNVGEDGRTAYGQGWHEDAQHGDAGPLDEGGGPSRFFYCAKASRGERNAGLEGFEAKRTHRYSEKGQGPLPQQTPSVGVVEGNVHPTVKPVDLMRWLVKVVTPPGGTVLDPFTGSGTTGAACVLEGFDFIGIEREPEYAEIAVARIGWWHKHRADGQAAAVLAAGEARELVELAGQGSLFDEEAA